MRHCRPNYWRISRGVDAPAAGNHIYLWWVLDDPRLLSSAARAVLEAGAVYVSSASIWAIAIKCGIGKLDADPQQLAEAIGPSGFDELPVRARHAAAIVSLPAHHKLRMVNNAANLLDLRVPPANRLEALKRKRAGQHSIRINDQWRICFVWKDGQALEVEITDYH